MIWDLFVGAAIVGNIVGMVLIVGALVYAIKCAIAADPE